MTVTLKGAVRQYGRLP